jgi:basic membrane protein A and related proteins
MIRRLILTAAAACSLLVAGSSSGARELKVAYITPFGSAVPNPRELFGLPLVGFRRAVEDFGIQGRVIQSDPKNWGKTLTSVARQKFDLIFPGLVVSARDFRQLTRVVREYPKTTFVVGFPYQAFETRPRNVVGTLFKAEEAAYLAGYLAARMEARRPGRDIVSSVGGIKVYDVDQWIAGYRAGAKRANPRVTALNAYSRSFADPAKCRVTALRQIAKGSGVIFNVAGGCGNGTLQAAKEKGTWAIGIDVDQSFYGPHILTSAVKRLDVWVYETMEALVKGKLRTGRTAFWNLRNKGVDVVKISPKVPPPLVREVHRIRAQIVAGKIEVPDEIK